jgi:hypothetical protein
MELGIQGLKGQVGVGRSAVLTAAGAIFLFFIYSCYSQNLILNGDFSDDGGSFEDWQVSHSISGSSYSGPTVVGSGYNDPYYARFTYETAGSDTLSQNVTTTPGAVYDINFWAEDGDGHNFGAEFNFGTFSANLINPFSIGPGEWATGWKDFNFEVTATELETDLSFVVNADSGSEFGVDDISVIPVPDFDGVAVGTNFLVTVASPAYSTIIQASTNMVNWVCVYTNMAPFTYTDCMSQVPRRFYRAAIVLSQSQ